MGVVVLLYIRFAAPRINRRLFERASGVSRLEGRQIDYEFTDEGYHIRTEHFEGFQKWAGVDRVIDDGEMILIVLGPNANFLPGRAFCIEGAEEGLRFLAAAAPAAGGAGAEQGRVVESVVNSMRGTVALGAVPLRYSSSRGRGPIDEIARTG